MSSKATPQKVLVALVVVPVFAGAGSADAGRFEHELTLENGFELYPSASVDAAAEASSMAARSLSESLSHGFQPEDGEGTVVAAVPDAESGSAAETDKSGTDPTKFLRTLGLRNDYQRLTNESSFNLTTLTYIEPFAEGRMNLRLKAPLAYTDATGESEFGLSDISLRYNLAGACGHQAGHSAER
jgi:hypothetical protein